MVEAFCLPPLQAAYNGAKQNTGQKDLTELACPAGMGFAGKGWRWHRPHGPWWRSLGGHVVACVGGIYGHLDGWISWYPATEDPPSPPIIVLVW